MSARIRWLAGVTGIASIPISFVIGFRFGLAIPLMLTVGAGVVGRWERPGRGLMSSAAVFLSLWMIPLTIAMLLEGGSHQVLAVVIGVAWMLLVVSCDVAFMKEARSRKRQGA